MHGTKKVFHDGGSIYNLSANPGGVIDHNYIYDNRNTVGLYLDEGSRYVTLSNNVIQDAGVWAFTNASGTNNTNDSTFAGNWYNTGVTAVAAGTPHNNVLKDNVQVTDGNWPLDAQQVKYEAGIEPALRTGTDAHRAPAGVALTATPASVGAGGSTVLTATVRDFSPRNLSHLKLDLGVPSGWSATETSRPERSVRAGGSVTVSWTVQAPAAVSSGTATFTVAAAYRSDGDKARYSGSASVKVATAG